MKKILSATYCLILLSIVIPLTSSFGQNIPVVYSNITQKGEQLVLRNPDTKEEYLQNKRSYSYTYSKISRLPEGTEGGLKFDFRDSTLNGTIYYGLVKTTGVRFPQPVFFKRHAQISRGVAKLKLKKSFSGKYDFVDWETTGRMIVGYRIVDDKGNILYDGRVNVTGKGPFTVDNSLREGPFVTLQKEDGVTIYFKTSEPAICSVMVDGKKYRDTHITDRHEIAVTGLRPDKVYPYTLLYGDWKESYSFRTAPVKGASTQFTWAYASDSRAGSGGGERNIQGTNAYIIKKMMVLAKEKGARFFQFTGDLINGYKTDEDAMNLEYANFKNAARLFWHYAPVNIAMGNHEALMTAFEGRNAVDRFPFATASAEHCFADNFVNPHNGPVSEDGASYDPSPAGDDFPSYDENAYYYTYGNMAMVALNSNYWYAPSTGNIPMHSGNVHGYIMDRQFDWLKQTIMMLEADPDIDHIFVTFHTPCFPNGGHSKDDMWYGGNNDIRPYIAGKPVETGIIERRDQILDLLINRSKKCVALLHGDEHNYSRLVITDKTPMYPEGWDKPRLHISRPFTQITNGAAGAPYYAQEKLPWSKDVQIFSPLNALMLLTIDGPKVHLEVINPDTFEKIEELDLK